MLQRCETEKKEEESLKLPNMEKQTSEELADVFAPLREKFLDFDKKGNGVLSKKEFEQALKEVGVKSNEGLEDFDAVFESFDVQRTGVVSIAEFTSVLGHAWLKKDTKRTVESVFKETCEVLLERVDTTNDLEKQFQAIFERLGVKPCSGTLDQAKFKTMLERELDWHIDDSQLVPLFHYLDLNNNGLVSVITIRFMVKEMAKKRSEGRNIIAVDLIKQAMSAAQGEMIRRQASIIKKQNKTIQDQHSAHLDTMDTLNQTELEVSGDHMVTPEDREHEKAVQNSGSFMSKKGKKRFKPKATIGSTLMTWPFGAIFGWVGAVICFVIGIVAATPQGDGLPHLPNFIWSGIFLCAMGAIHSFLNWPFIRDDDDLNCGTLIGTVVFGFVAFIYLILAVLFYTPMYYDDVTNCWSCQKCNDIDTNTMGICWGDWRLVGGYLDTCFCALTDTEYWDKAQFQGDIITDCNVAIAQTTNFESKECFYYDGGVHMQMGIALITFLTIAAVFACYGILKDIKHWNQYGLGRGQVLGDEEAGSAELTKKQYGSTQKTPDMYS